MPLHEMECGRNVRGSHPRHRTNGLRFCTHGQIDDDLAARTPNMAMLAGALGTGPAVFRHGGLVESRVARRRNHLHAGAGAAQRIVPARRAQLGGTGESGGRPRAAVSVVQLAWSAACASAYLALWWAYWTQARRVRETVRAQAARREMRASDYPQ